MTRVYVSEPGAVAGRDGGRLVVRQGGERRLRVPLAHVEQLVVVGRAAQVSTALLVELLRRGTQVAFLSGSGRYEGTALGAPGGGIEVQVAQHQFLADERHAVSFSRALVEEKIAGQLGHLEVRAVSGTARARLTALRARVRAAGSLDRVRGLEGAAAATYWQALAPLVPTGWQFAGRRYHPPPDPLNALVSFASTLLLHEVVAAVHLVGLDPRLGALHVAGGQRPSFALDLLEAFRPLGLELWVLDGVLDGSIRLTDLASTPAGWRLTPDGRRRFLERYDQQLGRRVRHPLGRGWIPLRDALELHARQAARWFAGEQDRWEGIGWR